MISIARARIEDASDLIAVKVRAFEEEKALYGFGPPGYDSMENQIRVIRDYFYYKILDDGKIVGGISVRPEGQGRYWIGAFYVDLSCQNRGVGTAAMNLLEREFPNALKWALETPYLSVRNHHFYEKMGFEKIRETPPDEKGFYFFVYEKRAKRKYKFLTPSK